MRKSKRNQVKNYDVVVVGSGFGGSVTALRLTEKGYSVGVIEAGRRWVDSDFAATSWNLRRFIWAPKLGLKGVQRIHALPDVVVLAGAGVGGGSLNYANTLYEPQSAAFFEDRQWSHITDWRSELAPYYDQAKRMLGVVTNPTMTLADEINKSVAQEMGVADTFRMAPVGVFFGPDDTKKPGLEVDDPFFGDVGPRRKGCLECGECMVGCRHGAKNTLVKNYLYLAEQAGAAVHPETTVQRVVAAKRGGYTVETTRSGAWLSKRKRQTFTANHVVFAAGTWGTQHLLHRLKRDGDLPQLSDRLGYLTRTNSEALVGASTSARQRSQHDFTKGVAITSSFHPDEHTHIEPVRYGKGQNAMGLLATLMTDGGGSFPRWAKWLGQVVRHPFRLAGHYLNINSWSERSTIALVMQTHDNSVTVGPKKGLFGRFKLTSAPGHGQPSPTWIPAANEAVRRMAKHIGGSAWGSVGEIFDIPMTAHFLGGCAIGDSPATGVVDPYLRVYGHLGLHIVDGSAVSANLGVNPALTITAQAERAMAMWPNRGEADNRPLLGSSYVPVAPIAPIRPAVPGHAPAALQISQRPPNQLEI